MTSQTSAVLDAIEQLADLRRSSAKGDGLLFALAWIAGARMVQRGIVPRISSLIEKTAWSAANPAIEDLCVDAIWGTRAPSQEVDLEIARAVSVVGHLIDRAPDFRFFVADALWYRARSSTGGPFELAPEACDLLFSLLQAPRGARIWIPFDQSGQLSSRAIRLGYSIEHAGPSIWTSDVQRLCRAILDISDETSFESAFVLPDREGRTGFQVDYLIAIPPVGGRMHLEMNWQHWEGADERLSQTRLLAGKVGSITHQLDRTDSWAPAALWPRVNRRAVFLAGQSLLFARGQEQRLRETWIRNRYQIDTVVSLPGRLYSDSDIASSILVFDRSASGHALRMADLNDLTIRARSPSRASKTLDLRRSLMALDLRDPFAEYRDVGDLSNRSTAITSEHGEKTLVKSVSFDEILDEDCSLQPNRYLRPRLRLLGNRERLRDLVEVIRAPVSTDDPYSTPVIEVGIPDLGVWRPVKLVEPAPGNQVRVVRLRDRRRGESELKTGDIVMSIKGTVGKTALIGEATLMTPENGSDTKTWSLVTSGNCIAIRSRSDKVTPEFLLMYFRSKEFQYQLETLLVGAVIAHVTPSELCDSVRVPIPSPIELAAIREKYERVCDLEAQAEVATSRIAEIVGVLWQPQL